MLGPLLLFQVLAPRWPTRREWQRPTTSHLPRRLETVKQSEPPSARRRSAVAALNAVQATTSCVFMPRDVQSFAAVNSTKTLYLACAGCDSRAMPSRAHTLLRPGSPKSASLVSRSRPRRAQLVNCGLKIFVTTARVKIGTKNYGHRITYTGSAHTSNLFAQHGSDTAGQPAPGNRGSGPRRNNRQP